MADASPAKHAALLIALGGKPKGGDDAEPDADDAKDEDMESTAVDDIWDAIQSKNKDDFGSSLKRYVQTCIAKSDGDEDDAAKEY